MEYSSIGCIEGTRICATKIDNYRAYQGFNFLSARTTGSSRACCAESTTGVDASG